MTRERGRPADQVVRRIELCAAHPGVTVVYRRDKFRWEAAGPAGTSTATFSSYELRRVLDELEQRLSQTGPREGSASASPPGRL